MLWPVTLQRAGLCLKTPVAACVSQAVDPKTTDEDVGRYEDRVFKQSLVEGVWLWIVF